MDYVLILLAALSAALFAYVLMSGRELHLRREYDRFAQGVAKMGDVPPPFEIWVRERGRKPGSTN